MSLFLYLWRATVKDPKEVIFFFNRSLQTPKGSDQNNRFFTLMGKSTLHVGLSPLDEQSLGIVPGKLEPALHIAVWIEPSM